MPVKLAAAHHRETSRDDIIPPKLIIRGAVTLQITAIQNFREVNLQ
jgi:hypothetical protein